MLSMRPTMPTHEAWLTSRPEQEQAPTDITGHAYFWTPSSRGNRTANASKAAAVGRISSIYE